MPAPAPPAKKRKEKGPKKPLRYHRGAETDPELKGRRFVPPAEKKYVFLRFFLARAHAPIFFGFAVGFFVFH